MSSIPNAKMKHAHAHEGDHQEHSSGQQADEAQSATGAPAPAAEQKGAEQSNKSTSGSSLSGRAKQLGGRIEDLAEDAVEAVKERPKTAAAIGAAVLAGAAALISGPAIAKAVKGEQPKKPAPKKKSKADKKD